GTQRPPRRPRRRAGPKTAGRTGAGATQPRASQARRQAPDPWTEGRPLRFARFRSGRSRPYRWLAGQPGSPRADDGRVLASASFLATSSSRWWKAVLALSRAMSARATFTPAP